MKQRIIFLCILFLGLLLSVAPSYAAINCDSTSLQNAINAANSGDTITCNAGSWTWTSQVTVTNKSLTILGAGIDQTIITTDTNGTAPFLATFLVTNTFRMSGFTWKLQSGAGSNGIISLNINNVAGYPPVCCRIDHMKMYGDPLDGVSLGGRFITFGGPYGLVDHVTMYSLTTRGAGNISMLQDNGVSTSNSYHIPRNPGDVNALFIEDCDFEFNTDNPLVGFHGNGGVDMYPGSRYVVRRSTIRNTDISNHGWDSGFRGSRSFEVYQNTFIADSMFPGIDVFDARSGTGIVWGNTVKNIQPQSGSTGYLVFFAPRHYAALTPFGLGGNINLNGRATGYYPTPPWGMLPYPGTSSVFDGINNYVTGSNPIDGNQMPPGHMDPQYTRTVNDLVTTSGSTTITSATANFNLAADQPKLIIGTNIQTGRVVTDGVWTSGSTTVTSATANFTSGDVGRNIGDININIPHGTTIASVTNSTTVVISSPANASGSGVLVLVGTYIVSVTNSTTAVLNTPATASGTNGTLTIGFTDQGYPLADQVGRGSFATANAGNWPNVTTGYTDANYEALVPIYLWLNHWQTVDGSLNVLTDTVPPATAVGLSGSEAYIKHLREWYDDPDTGSGTFSQLPATCTVGFGFWVTDKGGHWDTTTPAGTNNGALYRCTSTNVWTLFYTPYTYPWCAANIGTLGCINQGQTITFPSILAHVITDPPFNISATASSGLIVAFTSRSTSICTLVDNGNNTATVTLLAVGLCTIAANQPGNGTFTAAAEVDQSFPITSRVAPIQTALAAAIPNATSNTITVVSNANFIASTATQEYDVFVDGEMMKLLSQLGTSNTWTVSRGINRTRASAHPTGAIVFWGPSGPTPFASQAPFSGSSCISANYTFLPLIIYASAGPSSPLGNGLVANCVNGYWNITSLQTNNDLRPTVLVNDAAYNATINDEYILFQNLSAGRTVTLPAITGLVGKTYVVMNPTANGSTITVSGSAGQLFGTGSGTGTPTVSFSGAGAAMRFISSIMGNSWIWATW